MINYEEKYKKALEQAKAGKPMNEIFPELKESEDERIRKFLIDYFEIIKSTLSDGIWKGFQIEKILAYLEKQKEQKPNVELIQKSWYLEGYHDGKYNNEPKWLIQTGKGGARYEENQKYGTQKPAEWSDEDEWKMNELLKYLEEKGDYRSTWYSWLKSLPERFNLTPKQEWNEEDERLLNIIIDILDREEHNGHLMRGDLKACVKLLKSLRTQHHWKPSYVQMKYLDVAIAEADGHKSYNLADGLVKLKDDLEKLYKRF